MKGGGIASRLLFVGGAVLVMSFIAYVTISALTVVRHALAPAFLFPERNHKDPMSPPILVMIFLTRQGLPKTSSIWQDWYEDAKRALDRRGLEVSDYLRGIVHYHPNFTKAEVEVPLWLSDSIIRKPVESAWGFLLPAMYNALSAGLNDHPDGSYFIYLSESTVPLKSFTSIWGAIWADPRSRIDISCRDHFHGNPKHHQWIMLNSIHARYLVKNDEWRAPRVNWVAGQCATHVAASDEYWPLKTLRMAPRHNDFEEDFLLTGDAKKYDCLHQWTFAYWRQFHPMLASIALGEHDRDAGHPASFTSLDSGFLRSLVQREGLWFFRKVVENVPVTRCYLSLEAFHNEQLGRGEELMSPVGSEDERSCLLKHFLPRLWGDSALGQKPLSAA